MSVRTNDRDAEFTAFVAGQGARLAAFSTLLARDPHRGEDLLQSVLERTYLRWPQVRQDDPVGYVRRALLNANRDWYRRRTSSEHPTDCLPDRPALGDHVVDLVNRDAARRALATLTSRERAVIVLRYYEDLSEVEIARTLGIAPGTVKSACARALAKLRIAPMLEVNDAAHSESGVRA